MTTTTTQQPISIIKLALTRTITTTYFLTEAQLKANGLPTTVDELSALEPDTLAVTLIDEIDENDYAVDDQEIEITTETVVLAGE